MKHLAAAASALILLSGCREPETAGSTTETSPGGLEYTRLFIPDAEEVAIQIAWPTTWGLREDVNQAVPHIGADLVLAGGAEGFPPGEVVETFADLDTAGSLWATPEILFGELVVPRENLPRAIEIANAHLARPTMDADWFQRIRQGFAASMPETLAQPATQGFDALRWAVLGDSPLRMALTGDVQTIDAATRDDVLRWHKETLTRTGVHIVIAGDIDARTAGTTVDALMADLPEGAGLTAPLPKADFSPRRILLHVPGAQTSTLVFLGRLPPTRDGGEVDDVVLASILGEGDNSVLFDATRTKLRATYAFWAHIDAYARDLRVLVLSGEVETAKLAMAETVVREAYAAFRANAPVGDIARLKASFETHADLAASDPLAASVSAIMALLDGHDPGIALALTDQLDRVTDATLWSRAVSAFPAADEMIVLAVSPDANALPGACVIQTPPEATACR